MTPTMLDMATDSSKSDTHKPSRMVRIPEAMATALEEIAEEQFNNLTDQVKIAVREYLERNNRLPRPKGKRPPR
jgi:hypothetical protein